MHQGPSDGPALLLANPWVVEEEGDRPPAAAIRARYIERMRDPKQWRRLATGGVNLAKLGKGLAKLSRKPSEKDDAPARRMTDALDESNAPVTFLLAERDNTAIAFADAWDPASLPRARMVTRDTASHSFASAEDKDWLFARVMEGVAQ